MIYTYMYIPLQYLYTNSKPKRHGTRLLRLKSHAIVVHILCLMKPYNCGCVNHDQRRETYWKIACLYYPLRRQRIHSTQARCAEPAHPIHLQPHAQPAHSALINQLSRTQLARLLGRKRRRRRITMNSLATTRCGRREGGTAQRQRQCV